LEQLHFGITLTGTFTKRRIKKGDKEEEISPEDIINVSAQHPIRLLLTSVD